MKSIGILLDPKAGPLVKPAAGTIVRLFATDGVADPPYVVDGEQAYALYTLTDEADELAMKWSRAVVQALAADPRWTRILVHDGSDLCPLLVNRLFRGFFIEYARTALGVHRIMEASGAENVTLFGTGGVGTALAVAACRDLGFDPRVVRPEVAGRSPFCVPAALRAFAADILAPALRHPVPLAGRKPAGIPRIVFIERGVIHIEMVAQAFDALRAMREVEIVVLTFDPALRGRTYPHARYAELDRYQNAATLARLLAYQARALALRGRVQAWPASLPSATQPATLRFVQQTALSSIVHMLEVICSVLRIERPDLLITIDETGLLGKAAALAGRRRGIPTLNVQHGSRADSPWLEDQLFDRFAVFGPETAAAFVRRGNDPNIFVPTGAPRYDPLFRREGLRRREQVAAELKLDQERPIVTFASQRTWGRLTPGVKRDTWLALLRACRDLGAQLVIKLRAGQPDHVPPEATQEPAWEQVRVISDYDLYSLLAASDVVSTIHSTVGTEAIALGKPLLIINLTGQPDPVPYVAEGVAVGAYQPEEVAPALRTLLDARPTDSAWAASREEFIGRHLTSADGRSAERMARLMLDLAQRWNVG